MFVFFFFQAEDGIRDVAVTGVQTCALPIYLARDAAELIEVDYEALPAVADPGKALAKGAPAVHPQWPDNVAFTYHQDGGNIDKAFAEADVVVKQRITSQRLVPMAMETRGVVAEWRGADRQLNLYTSTQIPHLVRTLVAGNHGVGENRNSVVAPGGGVAVRRQHQVVWEEGPRGVVSTGI